MMIIGFSGKKGSGKDVASRFVASYINCIIASFAYPLKKGLEFDFPKEFSGELWESSDRSYRDGIMPSLLISRREALTSRGDALNAAVPGYFIKSFFSRMKSLEVEMNKNKLALNGFVIKDVRFKEEADAIREKGGLVIRIHRPETDHLAGDHRSEVDLDDYGCFDGEIINDSTELELEFKIKKFIDSWM